MRVVRHSVQIQLAATVGLAFLVLFPPAVLDGRYSQLEAALGLLAAVLLITRREDSEAVPRVPVALLGLLGLMAISAVWSSARWETGRDVLIFVLLGVSALLIARSAELNTIVIGIAAGGVVALLGSLFALAVSPDMALYHTGALQGLYGNRNSFGYVMLQCFPAALAMKLRFRGGVAVKVVVTAALAVAVIASDSRTSLIVLALAFLTWVAVLLLRRSWVYGAVAGGLVAVLLVVSLLNLDRVLGLLGKDSTLNGRVEIWSAALGVIGQSPVLGFGWSRSWPPASPHSLAVSEALGGHPVFHAHNEVLNWLVTTGVIGVVLIVALYGFVIWAGFRSYRLGKRTASIWLPICAVMLIGRGLSDISETAPQGWFILMLLVFASVQAVSEIPGRPIPKVVLLPIGRSTAPNTREPMKIKDVTA